jgi:hypothetical protein
MGVFFNFFPKDYIQCNGSVSILRWNLQIIGFRTLELIKSSTQNLLSNEVD